MTIIRATPKTAHNGFLLSNDTEINGFVAVFVGKNGAGKSRFFQSIKNGTTQVSVNGAVFDPNTEIQLLPPEQLTPNFGMHHDQNNLTQNIANTIRAYQTYCHLVDLPYDATHENLGGRMNSNPRYTQIYKLANFIASRIQKLPSELTEDDINLNYTEVTLGALGSHDVAGIFNRYCKKLNDNRYNRFRKEVDGEDVSTLNNDEFVKRFGPPPWEAINKILHTVFDGKFHFPIPINTNSKVYDHQTPLMERGNRVTNVGELSSGERTLLWLSLSLFNAQYNEKELLSAPRLLLLDEPDAFLHPKMVEKMYEVLQEFNRTFGTVFWLITHSPTTAALAPPNSLYLVHATSIEPIDTDAAVAELLDGVPQIAILPENRRSVYVESHYDAAIYQGLFEFLRKRSNKLNPKVSMNFVTAGPKMPEAHLIEVTKKIFGIVDVVKTQEFLVAVNGASNCNQVYAATETINQANNLGVKGLVDWDTKNKTTKNVLVIGEGQFYAIENFILDPICLILQLNLIDPAKYSIKRYSGEDLPWSEWIQNQELLQTSLNSFLLDIIGAANQADTIISYTSGLSLRSESRYTKMNGHKLQDVLWEKLPELNRIARKNFDGELMRKITHNIMINATSGRLIPQIIEEAFVSLQK